MASSLQIMLLPMPSSITLYFFSPTHRVTMALLFYIFLIVWYIMALCIVYGLYFIIFQVHISYDWCGPIPAWCCPYCGDLFLHSMPLLHTMSSLLVIFIVYVFLFIEAIFHGVILSFMWPHFPHGVTPFRVNLGIHNDTLFLNIHLPYNLYTFAGVW